MTTPNPTPEERANGWRDERPSLSTEFSPAHHGVAAWQAPYPAEPSSGEVPPDEPRTPPAIGRAYIPAPPFPLEPGCGWEALSSLGVAVTVALAGFPLGWLWSAVAPTTPVQMISDGAVLSQPEQEQMIADEGWYLFLTVLAGALAARARLGVPAPVPGSADGRRAGRRQCRRRSPGRLVRSPDRLAHFRQLARHAPVGSSFLAPVNLRVKQVGWWHGFLPYARGDVLAMAIAALVVYLLLAGFSSYPSLRGPDPEPVFALTAPDNGYQGTGYQDSSRAGCRRARPTRAVPVRAAARSVRARSDRDLRQRYRHRPYPLQQGHLATEQQALGTQPAGRVRAGQQRLPVG